MKQKNRKNHDKKQGNNGYKTKAFSRFEKKPTPAPFKETKEDRSRKKSSRKKTSVRERKEKDFPYPLNKYMAHCGVCARRKAVDHIKAGDVKVNGKTILEPGFKVTQGDRVTFRKKVLQLQKTQEYFLLNKPKDCLTTTKDPKGRRTVMDYLRKASRERIYPVGRLDRNTSGLLLITNDGDLAQKLSHPSGEIEKVYHVTLDKPLTKNDFDRVVSGITLKDGRIAADALAYVETGDHTQVGLEIHSGKNRIVRRIFEHLGYDVKKLDRVVYAGLTKKNLPRGKWRRLTDKEIRLLKHFKSNKTKKRSAKKK